MTVHLAAACDVFDGVLFCAVLFPHEMSWMRSGTDLSQFLNFFPTYSQYAVLAVFFSRLSSFLP